MDRDAARRAGPPAAYRSLAHLAVIRSTAEPSFAAWRGPSFKRPLFHLVERAIEPGPPLWLRRWFPSPLTWR